MASNNVGEIVYDVQMNVRQLIEGQQQVNDRMDRMERSADGASKSFSKLSGVAAALGGILSAKKIAEYAEAWTVLNNKLVNSIKIGENLAQVNERVFKIAQDSRSSIDGVATLYSRLERATQNAGVSGSELAKITTTITKAMAVSGATAAESEGALIQLSQALASGVLRGQEFNSMSEQAPALMKGLADSLGVGIGQLRKMAGQGELTTDVLLKSFKEMGPKIEKEFSNTMATMGQSITIATNNLTKFVGESSTVKAGVAVFNDVVVTLSENLDSLGGLLTVAAAVIGSRFVGALAMATAAQVRKMIATREATLADAAAANQAALSAAAELRSALAAKQRAVAELESAASLRLTATSAAAAASAEALLSTRRVSAATATDNYNRALAANAAAQAASATAARNASASVGLMRGALGLIGGPVGVAMLAASAIMYFNQRAKEARDSANSLADGVNTLVQKFREMSRTEISASIAKLRQSMPELTDAVRETKAAFNEATKTVTYYENVLKKYDTTTKKGRDAAYFLTGALDRQALTAEAASQAQNRLSQAQSGVIMGQAELNGGMRTGADLLSRNASEATIAGNAMSFLGKQLDIASRAKDKFNSTSLEVPRSGKADEYLADLKKETDLLAITDKKQRAVTKARMEAEEKGGNTNQIRQAQELAGVKYDQEQAESALKKETAGSAKEESKAAQAEKRRAEQLAELGDEMAIAELKMKGLNREAAQLAAVQDLGVGASQAQIQQATEQAGQIFDIQQRAADKKAALDADSHLKAEQQRKQDTDQLERQLSAGDITFEQSQRRRAEIAANYSQAIAEAQAKAAVTPQQEAAARVDPVQALANENAQKLALIQQFEEQRIITTSQADALINAQKTTYEQQRMAAQEQLFIQQSETNAFMMSMVDAMGARMTNMITGMLTGTQSLTDAMRNLASTILEQAVGALVQMGVQYIKNMMIQNSVEAAEKARMAANGAMYSASVAAQVTGMSAMAAQNAFAATAAIPLVGPAMAPGAAAAAGAAAAGLGAPAISTAPVAGARKHGGPVSAGSMYRVGEGGMPEIFQANNGRQYMIPGDNGNVVSNKDMQGSGSGEVSINVNVINQVANAQPEVQGYNSETRTVTLVIKEVANQLRNRTGEVSRGLEQGYNVSGKAQ